MNETLDLILSSHDINGARLRNRLAVAPMTRVSATEQGLATRTMHDYYLRFAKGGFGLITTEGLYVDKAFSQGYLNQPGLADDEQAQSWADITCDLQQNGAHVFAQLMHAGALCQGNRFEQHTVAPSARQPIGHQMNFYYGDGCYALPKAITEAQIQDVIQAFVDSALRAVQIAGFDGIEIHGANGYLLDQFLSSGTNQRTDRWGGDVRGRVTLLVKVVEAVKAAVGQSVPVGIRISQSKVNDFGHKWPGGESDAKVIFGALAQVGADFIHVTEHKAWQPAFSDGQNSLLELARRYAPQLTLIANGSLHDQQRARDALKAGADIVALGRGALSNPDLPQVFAVNEKPRPFDPSILSPIADIKPRELAEPT